MNSDDFEKRLQSQPLRQIPNGWREQILTSATSSRPSTLDPRPSLLSTIHHQLSTLLWPNPKAWIGLAAVWVLIFAIRFESHTHAPVLATVSTPSGREIAITLKDEQKILVELMENNQPHEADRPRQLPSQPHSELREPFSIA
jgi:hypothetical protein